MRRLLALKAAYPELELDAAEVVSREPSNWYNTFVIDKGAADGVALNQPVISADKALVGRISEVGTTWSRVITLIDPAHSVGAEIVRSGEYGVAEGDSSDSLGGNLRLSFISKNANIIVGDKIMTSGLGGIYPKGLIIGKVLEIRPDMQGISQYAIIAPDADIESINAVLIVKNDMN
ncbi:MAG: rod shape-determining protein MreC [Clostridia bacterium]|nr:rod shape-determining protein MreC [Clostridia bacterium]